MPPHIYGTVGSPDWMRMACEKPWVQLGKRGNNLCLLPNLLGLPTAFQNKKYFSAPRPRNLPSLSKQTDGTPQGTQATSTPWVIPTLLGGPSYPFGSAEWMGEPHDHSLERGKERLLPGTWGKCSRSRSELICSSHCGCSHCPCVWSSPTFLELQLPVLQGPDGMSHGSTLLAFRILQA